MVEHALAAALSAIVITDHDTLDGAMAARRLAPDDLEVVVGCEVSLDDGSQIIGMGLDREISRRSFRGACEEIHGQGGLVLLPHPFRRGSGVFRPERRWPEQHIREVLATADLVEACNGRDHPDATRRGLRFATERHLPAVAGSDAHAADEVGTVFVDYEVDGPLSHGRGARALWFPELAASSEPRLRRWVMEFYHRHRDRLPGAVHRVYRQAHQTARRTTRGEGVPSPRPQWHLDGPPPPGERP